MRSVPLVAAAVVMSSLVAEAAPKSIKVLLVCGGCCHDYGRQKEIIAKGLAERAHIETTVVQQGGASVESRIPLYENPDWAAPYDVIVHDECFSGANDPAWVARVLKPHKEGKPAVVLHCAMHSYAVHGDDWFDLCGVVSRRHGAAYPHDVTNVDPKHPIMKEFGPVWNNPAGELYWIEKVLPTAHVLASSRNKENGRDEVSVWTNEYNRKARVFGTTIGHHNVTVESDEYLDLLTRGVLWAADRLSPEMFKKEKPKTVRENLAKDRPTLASSEEAAKSNFAKNAVDGDPTTRWCAAGPAAGEWIQVDLGAPQRLTGVRIDWESGGAVYRFKVEGSSDAKSWRTLADGAKNDKAGPSEVDFAADGVRFIKLTFLGSDTGNWGSVNEFELLGTRLVAASKPPTEALLREAKIPPGYEATVFAAPPMVVYPVFVAAAPGGDVYVSVDRNGSLDRASHRGSVVRLRDLDGDGRADESKPFVKDVDSPRGLVWDHDRLYLMHPPHLSAFVDKNGDGEADEQKILVKNIAFGFKDRPADHTSNGVTLGIDGWLYLAIGDFGFMEAEGTDGRKLRLRGGGVVRVRPDGTGLELYSRGTRNILEVSVDPLLNGFARDNTNDGGGWDIRLHHFSGLENHGYPSLFRNFTSETVAPLAIYGGGSGCGGLYLDEPGFPAGDSPALYTADWGRERVYRHHPTPRGATFETDQSEFLGLPRVTDLDVDGSSRLYAASWKGASFTYVGENVGYMIRLTPQGYRAEPLPNFETAASAELVRLLGAESARRRTEAQRAILRRGLGNEVAPALIGTAANRSLPLKTRVAALFTLKQALGAEANARIAPLLDDPTIREWALRAWTDRKDQLGAVDPARIASYASDPNPRVRLQVAVSLARAGDSKQAAALSPLLTDSDALVAHTAIESMAALGARDAALAVVDRAGAPAVMRKAALRVLQQLHDEATVAALIERLAKSKDVAGRVGIFAALCRLHDVEGTWRGDSWGTRPDTSGPYYQAEPWSMSGRIERALRETLESAGDDEIEVELLQLALHKIGLTEGRFLFANRDGLAELVARAAKNPKLAPGVVAQIARLTTLTAVAEEFLIVVAADPAISDDNRLQAVVGASRSSNPKVLVGALIGAARLPREGEGARYLSEAKRAVLGSPAIAAAEPELIELAEKPDAGVAVWAEALLLERTGVAGSISGASIERGLEDPKRLARILDAVALTENRKHADLVRKSLADKNPEVASAARAAAQALRLDRPTGGGGGGRPIKGMDVERVLDRAVALKGNKETGRALFTRLNCVNCHTVSPHEPPKGPYLGNIATTYKRRELAESILRPSKTLAQGFVTQAFALDDGSTVVGFVVKESAEAVTIRTADAKEIVLPSKRIEERSKRDVSIMPEGLANDLTLPEFASLLDFLEAPNAK